MANQQEGDLEVDIDLDLGTVLCVPDMGNCSVKAEKKVKWKKLSADREVEFRLRFHGVPVSPFGQPASGWPFDPSAPRVQGTTETPWVNDFEGTAVVVGVFKYTVEVRDPKSPNVITVLDPIFIVRH